MHSTKHKFDVQFLPRFLTVPLCNKLYNILPKPVQVESYLRDFDALILCTSGMSVMFLLEKILGVV